jgi:hypothetical protein
VLSGEVHGTQELPRFFGEAVCATATGGLPVEVGLEIPTEDQAVVERFLTSAGGVSDIAALLETPFWTDAYQDGRRSQAMLALLQRLRDLRARGFRLDVFGFDAYKAKSPGTRDAAMAEAIVARARAHPDAVTLALAGEVHAWKAKGTPWNPEFETMGWHLVNAGVRTWSLGRSTPAGQTWVCTGGAPSDCGPQSTPATTPLPGGRTRGIEMLSQPSKRGNDGMYAVPTLTMSPPARGAAG